MHTFAERVRMGNSATGVGAGEEEDDRRHFD